MSFTVGVDLGQTGEYSGFAVLGETEEKIPKKVYEVRHMERHRKESYSALVEHLRSLVSRLPDKEIEPLIAVDSTSVGQPVVDMIAEAKIPGSVYGVTITGGDAMSRDGKQCRVPKRELVSTVAILLQTGRLRIARDLPHAALLERELKSFRAKITLSEKDTEEAWRERDHDDLVLAVSIAAWLRERGEDPWDRWFREEKRWPTFRIAIPR
jgi:Terminase RNaseH-like domain